MPRKKREESPTGVYHWIARGMHKKDLFHDALDYQHFRELLIEYKTALDIAIYHYCFMTNHIHMLLKTDSLDPLIKFSHYIQRRYAYYYCFAHHWVGNVFQRGYRSIPVESDTYLLECGRYIERNPIKAGLAKDPADYPYSSFRFYGGAKEDHLIDVSPAYLGLAATENERMATYIEYTSQERLSDNIILLAGQAPF